MKNLYLILAIVYLLLALFSFVTVLSFLAIEAMSHATFFLIIFLASLNFAQDSIDTRSQL